MKYLAEFENWASDVVTETLKSARLADHVLTEAKGHLPHPEDDVFLKNDIGAAAINAMEKVAANPRTVTIKWDGYPALIFGRGPDGKFTIMDKHMFNKKDTTARQLHSLEDWIAYEQRRGEKTRSELIDIIKVIWAGLEKECQGKGYYWGDLLFRQPLAEKNGMYSFKANPNGISYTVDVNSEIGKIIQGKVAGIAVHQFLPPTAVSTDEASSLNGTIGELKNDSNVAIVPSAMPVVPEVKLDAGLVGNARAAVSRYRDIVDNFIENAPQSRNAFEQLFLVYINTKIVSGNLSNLVKGFMDWIQRRPMTATMKKKLLGYDKVDTETNNPEHVPGYLESNMNAIKAAFTVWIAIYNLKSNLTLQLDKAAAASPVKGYLADGTQTQEGFVSQGYKFVNRMGFARQNLAGRTKPVTEDKAQGRVIVVYGGGFQPFHQGHLSSYLEAKEAFPGADFYVAASADVKTRPIPFDAKEFLAKQAGVTSPFVQVKVPINPREIVSKYNPEQDVLILVRSERDPVPYTKLDGTPAYYQPFVSLDKCQSFSEHGYVFVTKKHTFAINGEEVYSGSQVRNMYASADDQEKLRIIKQLYPRSTKTKQIKQVLDKYLGELTEADHPGYQQSTISAIPGTPSDLRPSPTDDEIQDYQDKIQDLRRFMGRPVK